MSLFKAAHHSDSAASTLRLFTNLDLLMFAKYSDNIFCSGDVSPRRVADLKGDLIAEKRRWGVAAATATAEAVTVFCESH